jgi:hypothetical protein
MRNQQYASVTNAGDVICQHVFLKLLLLEQHFKCIADIENAGRPCVRCRPSPVTVFTPEAGEAASTS